MDAKEDDPDIDNPGFASFGAATFGHAFAPTLDNDGDDVRQRRRVYLGVVFVPYCEN